MTKPKSWPDHSRSLDADRLPDDEASLTDLVVEARAVEWNFATWCGASGYDASNPNARRLFECLLAYARREGRAGLH
jgi:hypothetical protein